MLAGPAFAQAVARVVVIGGGFGGASCARALRKLDSKLLVTLIEPVGNLGSAPWHYLMAPSDVNGDSLIAVGAVDAAGVPAAFSSYGGFWLALGYSIQNNLIPSKTALGFFLLGLSPGPFSRLR